MLPPTVWRRHGTAFPITFFFFHVSCHCGACDLCRPPCCLPAIYSCVVSFAPAPLPASRPSHPVASSNILPRRAPLLCALIAPVFVTRVLRTRQTASDAPPLIATYSRDWLSASECKWWSFTWPAWPAAQRNLQITNRFMVPCNVSLFFLFFFLDMTVLCARYLPNTRIYSTLARTLPRTTPISSLPLTKFLRRASGREPAALPFTVFTPQSARAS